MLNSFCFVYCNYPHLLRHYRLNWMQFSGLRQVFDMQALPWSDYWTVLCGLIRPMKGSLISIQFHGLLSWNFTLTFVLRFTGLPDVAGLAGAGDQTWRALHHPWERWQPLATVRPRAKHALSCSPCSPSSCWGRWGGCRYARPHRQGQHTLNTQLTHFEWG